MPGGLRVRCMRSCRPEVHPPRLAGGGKDDARRHHSALEQRPRRLPDAAIPDRGRAPSLKLQSVSACSVCRTMRARWLKINKLSYSQNEGRRELFDKSAGARRG